MIFLFFYWHVICRLFIVLTLLKLNKLKSLLGIKSLVTEISGNRQSAANNMAMLTKYNATNYYSGSYDSTDFDDKLIEIDEMQIDKLYQSL